MRLYIFIFGFFYCSIGPVQSQDINLSDTTKYPWYHPEMNLIQFHSRSAIEQFEKKWKAGKEDRFSIVHTGDSHIQSDISTDVVRKKLQALHGEGGRGMMFPYSTANSYSSSKYKTTHTGEWEYGKTMHIPPSVPLGVAGMASRTSDSTASFTLTWNEKMPAHYTKLRVYCNRSPSSFDLRVTSAGETYEVPIDTTTESDTLPYVSLELKTLGPDIEFQLFKNNEQEDHFEIHGVELLSNVPGGLVYHACGVGGSRFRGILYEVHFESHLSQLEPDLVILDFGTNDYLYDDSIKAELPDEIRQIVARIRKAAPHTSILLTTTQDLYYRYRNISSGHKFSSLIRSLAKELDCMFWDWYWVSGGQSVLKKWRDEGLAQRDLIHLTAPGYRLKGRLLAEAFAATMDSLRTTPDIDSLIMDTRPLLEAQSARLKKEAKTDPSIATGNAIIYTIRSGDTLGHIAQRYGVSVRQLQQWNNLRGSMIIAGKTLRIYK